MTVENIYHEIDYIRDFARSAEARTIVFGPFVFFATETGDAWILDATDDLAACLMKSEEPRDVLITETAAQFGIGWNAKYMLNSVGLAIADEGGQAMLYTSDIAQSVAKAIRQAIHLLS